MTTQQKKPMTPERLNGIGRHVSTTVGGLAGGILLSTGLNIEPETITAGQELLAGGFAFAATVWGFVASWKNKAKG